MQSPIGTVIRWEDPPRVPRGRRTVDVSAILDELRTKPGYWALVGEGRTATQSLRKHLVEAGCEVSGVNTQDKEKVQLYAKWVTSSDIATATARRAAKAA